MVEQLSLTPDTVVVYSGTALSNFRNQSIVTESGLVLFDKGSNPNHSFPQIYFTTVFSLAVGHGVSTAIDLSDIPAIMEGSVPIEYKREKRLPLGILFTVDGLWIPTVSITERMIVSLLEGVHNGIFTRVNPKEYLS